MPVHLLNLLTLALCFSFIAAKSKESDFKKDDVITVDVAVIGGGSTGTYAAVKLRDAGKSIVVIERDDHLGGHVNTYVDPITHVPIDYGVVAYNNLPQAQAFFKRFSIALQNASVPTNGNTYVDLSGSGAIIPVPTVDPSAALQKYAGIIAQYPYLTGGYALLPDPMPAELLAPFGKFISDNGLEAMVGVAFLFTWSMADILNQPAYAVLMNFGPIQLNDLFQGTYQVVSTHDNSALYRAAAAYLGKVVLYGSRVIDCDRDGNDDSHDKKRGYHLLTVSTPNGKKLVKSRKLLITIPPTLDNMAAFDISETEHSVFKQWLWHNNYVAVLANTGLPDGQTILPADPTKPFGLPSPPFVQQYSFSGFPGIYTVRVVGDSGLGPDAARKLIGDDLGRMAAAGSFPSANRNPTILAFANHNPLNPFVSSENAHNGFYKKLNALQGQRATWWTGQAWTSDYSSLLWAFTDGILAAMG